MQCKETYSLTGDPPPHYLRTVALVWSVAPCAPLKKESSRAQGAEPCSGTGVSAPALHEGRIARVLRLALGAPLGGDSSRVQGSEPCSATGDSVPAFPEYRSARAIRFGAVCPVGERFLTCARRGAVFRDGGFRPPNNLKAVSLERSDWRRVPRWMKGNPPRAQGAKPCFSKGSSTPHYMRNVAACARLAYRLLGFSDPYLVTSFHYQGSNSNPDVFPRFPSG